MFSRLRRNNLLLSETVKRPEHLSLRESVERIEEGDRRARVALLFLLVGFTVLRGFIAAVERPTDAWGVEWWWVCVLLVLTATLGRRLYNGTVGVTSVWLLGTSRVTLVELPEAAWPDGLLVGGSLLVLWLASPRFYQLRVWRPLSWGLIPGWMTFLHPVSGLAILPSLALGLWQWIKGEGVVELLPGGEVEQAETPSAPAVEIRRRWMGSWIALLLGAGLGCALASVAAHPGLPWSSLVDTQRWVGPPAVTLSLACGMVWGVVHALARRQASDWYLLVWILPVGAFLSLGLIPSGGWILLLPVLCVLAAASYWAYLRQASRLWQRWLFTLVVLAVGVHAVWAPFGTGTS